MRAIYECGGVQIPVNAFERYARGPSSMFTGDYIRCRVTLKQRQHGFEPGEVVEVHPRYLWRTAKFVGRLKTHTLWQGRIDWQSLPVVDAPSIQFRH